MTDRRNDSGVLMAVVAIAMLTVPHAASPRPESAGVSPNRVQISVAPDEAIGQSTPLTLEAFVYKPPGPGRHPVVIFNHGSSGGAPRLSLPAESIASVFVSRGFVVIVPMRRGRGASGGQSLESEDKNCDLGSWAPGLRGAFDDVTAAFDYADTLPYADASRTIVAGVSRGGYLSVAYAAEGVRRSRIVGVVNLVGGWVAQAEDNCPTDFNTVSYSRFGRETQLPQLWIYGDHDPFYLTSSIMAYRDAFQGGGGRLQFRLVGGLAKGGHSLGNQTGAWKEDLDRYLRALKLP